MPEKEKKRRISKEKLKYLKNHLENKHTVTPPSAKDDKFNLVLLLVSLPALPCIYLLLW